MNPQEIDIPIRLVTGYTEMNTISFENVEAFSDASCLILEDLFTGISYELFDTTSFTVLISDTTKMARFILHIGASSELITEGISCFEQNDAQLIFSTNSTNPFDIVWKDSLNNVLSSTSGLTNADTLSNLASGAYVVESTNSLCGTTIDTVIVIQPQEITAQFSANQDTVYLPNSATVEFTNQSTNAVTYFWDFDDLTSSSLASPSHQFTLAGTYNVTLTAAQDSNCFKQSSSTIVVIEELLTAIDLTHNKQNLEKIWINNNQLIVEGNDINLIEVKNTLGQTILQTTKKVTNLSTLSSQVLFVTVFTNTSHSISKVNFIKK
jgi:PKD repeat protein